MSLTIGSSGNLNELLASMLAQMNGTASSATPSAGAPASTSSIPVSATSGKTNNAVVGSGRASYSNEIMRLFSQMHQSVSASPSNNSTSSSSAMTATIASATTRGTPIDAILPSIDTNNDATTTTAAAAEPDASDPDASASAPWSAHVRALRPDA